MLNKQAHLSSKALRSDVPMAATRDGFGIGMVEIGEKNNRVVAVCSDVTESVRLDKFRAVFPGRFVQTGVAEQTLVSASVGLALAGKIPFAAAYGVFSPGRNWDQIRVGVCFNNANVKLIGSHAGVSTGEDGGTHQALEDIALTRVLPNMTVLVPADSEEARKAVHAVAELKGPVYIRLSRPATPVFTTEKTPFSIGKSSVLMNGEDVAIIGTGPIVYEALLAADRLLEQGIKARVINLACVKPLDHAVIERVAKECGAVVTCEEHQISGGAGSAVAEFLAQTYPVPIEMVGVRDRFGESGKTQELLDKHKLNADGIVSAVKKVVKRKK